jgi:hypothetical protein
MLGSASRSGNTGELIDIKTPAAGAGQANSTARLSAKIRALPV